MVVNGTDVFVGSDEEKGRANIRRALRRPAAVGLALQAETAAGHLQIAYKVGAVPKTAVLHLALVERGLTTDVPRGENSGRTLSHDNVVRWFETLQLDAGARKPIRVKMPAVNRNNSAVIGYVQDLASMAILGASTVSLAR